MEYVTLSNGIKMPVLGYGVYQVTKDECERCVTDALKAGYRSIDTAQSYFNEEEVGNAIQKAGIPRDDLFITTKVWVEHYGYDACKRSVDESLRKLKTDYKESRHLISRKAHSSHTMIQRWWNGSYRWLKRERQSTEARRRKKHGNENEKMYGIDTGYDYDIGTGCLWK